MKPRFVLDFTLELLTDDDDEDPTTRETSDRRLFVAHSGNDNRYDVSCECSRGKSACKFFFQLLLALAVRADPRVADSSV